MDRGNSRRPYAGAGTRRGGRGGRKFGLIYLHLVPLLNLICLQDGKCVAPRIGTPLILETSFARWRDHRGGRAIPRSQHSNNYRYYRQYLCLGWLLDLYSVSRWDHRQRTSVCMLWGSRSTLKCINLASPEDRKLLFDNYFCWQGVINCSMNFLGCLTFLN